MRRFLAYAAAALSIGLAGAAYAATTNIWSNVVGGFPTWYGAPTFSANAYTLSAPLPTYPAYSLVNQQHVRIIIPSGGTNTGAVTLNVASTGALPVVSNLESGLAAFAGGELVAGLEYDLTYSTSAAAACSNSCYVLSWLAQGPVLAGTSQTVTAAQWAAITAFEVTTTGQTLTLPASSGLSPNGAIIILTGAYNVTVTPNSADAITYGSVVYAANTSITLPAGTLALVTSPASGKISISATTTFAVAAGGYATRSLDVPTDTPGAPGRRLPASLPAAAASLSASAFGAP